MLREGLQPSILAVIAVISMAGVTHCRNPNRGERSDPRHPYTQALLSVIPVPNPRRRRKRMILVGETPNPIDLPSGCRFHPRCPVASARCSQTEPQPQSVDTDHQVACLSV